LSKTAKRARVDRRTLYNWLKRRPTGTYKLSAKRWLKQMMAAQTTGACRWVPRGGTWPATTHTRT